MPSQPPVIFRCQYCVYITPKARIHIYRHLIKCHGDKLPYYCDTCGKPFPGKEELSAHKHFAHVSYKYPKNKAKTAFTLGTDSSTEADVDPDLTIISGKRRRDRKFVCWKCGVNLRCLATLLDHILFVHYNMLNYGCDLCSRRFKSTELLKNHMKLVHDDTVRYMCRYCDFATFRSKMLLYKHYHKFHHNNSAIEFFKGTPFVTFEPYLPSLVMGGTNGVLRVMAPVVTRCCEELCEKAVDYNKVVVAQNISSILSILGVHGEQTVNSPSVEPPTIDLSTNRLITGENALEDTVLPFTTGSSTETRGEPVITGLAVEDIKLEPTDCVLHETDITVHDIKEELVAYSNGVERDIRDEQCENDSYNQDAMELTYAVKQEADSNSSSDEKSSSRRERRSHYVDFTENRICEESSEDEEEMTSHTRQTHRKRRESVDNDGSYRPTDEEDDANMETFDEEDRLESEESLEEEEEVTSRTGQSRRKRRRVDGYDSYQLSDEEDRVKMELDDDGVQLERCKNGERRKLAVSRYWYGFDMVISKPAEGPLSYEPKYRPDSGFHCTHCDFKTKWKKSLKHHVVAKHERGDIVYSCDQCDYTSTIRSYLLKHTDRKHNMIRFKCSQCSASCSNVTDLKDHIALKHDKVYRHQCPLCPFKCGYRSELWTHKKKYHNCVKCAYTHSDTHELANHMRDEHGITEDPHTRDRKWRCTKLGCEYVGTVSLKAAHMADVHEVHMPPRTKKSLKNCRLKGHDPVDGEINRILKRMQYKVIPPPNPSSVEDLGRLLQQMESLVTTSKPQAILPVGTLVPETSKLSPVLTTGFTQKVELDNLSSATPVITEQGELENLLSLLRQKVQQRTNPSALITGGLNRLLKKLQHPVARLKLPSLPEVSHVKKHGSGTKSKRRAVAKSRPQSRPSVTVATQEELGSPFSVISQNGNLDHLSSVPSVVTPAEPGRLSPLSPAITQEEEPGRLSLLPMAVIPWLPSRWAATLDGELPSQISAPSVFTQHRSLQPAVKSELSPHSSLHPTASQRSLTNFSDVESPKKAAGIMEFTPLDVEYSQRGNTDSSDVDSLKKADNGLRFILPKPRKNDLAIAKSLEKAPDAIESPPSDSSQLGVMDFSDVETPKKTDGVMEFPLLEQEAENNRPRNEPSIGLVVKQACWLVDGTKTTSDAPSPVCVTSSLLVDAPSFANASSPTIVTSSVTVNLITSAGVPSNTSIPSTSAISSTVDAPSSVDTPLSKIERSTMDEPWTSDVPLIMEFPSAVDLPSTMGPPSSVDLPSTMYPPSFVDLPSTVGPPSTVDLPSAMGPPSTVDLPSTMSPRSSVNIFPTMGVSSTDSPSSMDMPSTTDAPSIDMPSTIGLPLPHMISPMGMPLGMSSAYAVVVPTSESTFSGAAS